MVFFVIIIPNPSISSIIFVYSILYIQSQHWIFFSDICYKISQIFVWFWIWYHQCITHHILLKYVMFLATYFYKKFPLIITDTYSHCDYHNIFWNSYCYIYSTYILFFFNNIYLPLTDHTFLVEIIIGKFHVTAFSLISRTCIFLGLLHYIL